MAKRNKNDEFYTLYKDIEKELQHYEDQLKGKTIYCNCDTVDSNFVKYFLDNKDRLGINLLHSSIDFRSQESIDMLVQSDIVITNPPFSLFREYIAQLVEYDKKFLIIGSQNAITYKEVFPLIRDNKVRVGHNSGGFTFTTLDGGTQKLGNICWYTSLDVTNKPNKIVLTKTYNPIDYPKYDNYDAINVNRLADIPYDYDGVMGVPITFMDKYSSTQFEIVGQTGVDIVLPKGRPYINEVRMYARILIKKQFEILDCCEPCIDIDVLKQDPKFKEYKSRQTIRNGKVCQKTYHRILIKKRGDKYD